MDTETMTDLILTALVALALWWLACQAAVFALPYFGYGLTDVTISGIQAVLGALFALGAKFKDIAALIDRPHRRSAAVS
jgi:hypothetical protein